MYLAFTGFTIFLVTAAAFGASGRGIIGYGTSLFAMLGSFFSANLGRSFLAATKQQAEMKELLLRRYLVLNFVLTIATMVTGIIYWRFSSSAQEVLSPFQILCFSTTSLFYVWSVNGNAIFAALSMTKTQEIIIILIRSCLMVFLASIYFVKNKSIDQFILGYSFILFSGSLTEILWLYFHFRPAKKSKLKTSKQILKDSFFHHIDFLSFNIFPLFLTVLLATHVTKSEIGQFNFALQIINLIFLFSVTANIRLITYVSDVGFRARISQYKKLFIGTLVLSGVSIIVIFVGLRWITLISYFSQFQGVDLFFLIFGLSVPGYILYQFFSPIWIELHRQKEAAFTHGLNFLFFLVLSPIVLSKFQLEGAVWLFSLFHCGLIFTQLYLFKRYAKA